MSEDKNKAILRKHIARLQHQNSILAECLTEERWRRQNQQKWYEGRLRSKIATFVDCILICVGDCFKK